MSELKHAPWVANPDGEVVSEEYVVDGVTYVDHICNCEVINGESPEARLIAASPDLLEACQRARNQFYAAGYEPKAGSMNPTDCLLAQLIAAISKATGE